MSLSTNVSSLATRIATEFKTLRTELTGNAQGSLADLDTADKTSLVAAINEVVATGGGAGDLIDDSEPSQSTTYSSQKIETLLSDLEIPDPTDLIDDSTPSTSTVYSSTQTNTAIAEAIADLFETAPDTLDTIDEIAQAIQDNAEALADLSPVRYVAQTLNGSQQAQARTNIDAAKASGDDGMGTVADYVAAFEAGLE